MWVKLGSSEAGTGDCGPCRVFLFFRILINGFETTLLVVVAWQTLLQTCSRI